MKKRTTIFLTFILLTLTACGSAPRATSADPGFASQGGTATGELSASMQIAIGTLKLDGMDNAVTSEQAAELLPLWETMQVLENSDTAAKEEIEALSTQIQETMTKEQMQAITAMNLTRQDMFSIMQAQGAGTGTGRQSNKAQNGNSFGNGNRNFTFGPGSGGPPPEERFAGGGSGFGGGGQGQIRSAQQVATAQAARQAGSGNRIPAPLINAVIEFLKKKAGS